MSRLVAIQRPESAQEFHDYCLYGVTIRSEIPLTFLKQPVSEPADVKFSFAPSSWFAEMTDRFPNCADPGDWYERRRGPDGSDFLRWPDLFEFMVSPNGRSVACGMLEHATAESFQTYLLGHVLSYALVKQGYEPLHATTIVIDGQAIALLGDSGQGKSTLAAAFLHAGHQILTDDLLLIRDVRGVLCGSPGPPRIKLFPHIARQFLPKEASFSTMNPDTEKMIIGLGREHVHADPAPIRAFLVLDECKEDGAGMRLSLLSGKESVLQLLGSTFNRRLVTSERLRRQFLAAREWSKRIPVWRMEYRRELADIDHVRNAILSHAFSSGRLER